jgi:SAM-dependent methyltransferase
MFSKFKRLFNRGDRGPKLEPLVDDDRDLSWLDPPKDRLDVTGWDRYWLEHVRHGLGPPLFDMFCDDRGLVAVMNDQGMTSVLCAGSGISQEPKALAEAGFKVVALDLSPQAIEIARGFQFPAKGFEFFCEPGSRRPGGRVDFVVGTFLDSTVCPGPFDVIIERRTAQLFFGRDIGSVLGTLAQRLGQDGIFLSHCHDAAWKPPASPRHFTESWFRENGWTIWSRGPGRKPPGRVAWLSTSTG